MEIWGEIGYWKKLRNLNKIGNLEKILEVIWKFGIELEIEKNVEI